MSFAGVLLIATLSVAAEPRPKAAEVGDAVRVTVSVAGTGLSQVQSVTPPKMPPGLEIGPAQGPKIERRIEVLNRQQVQSERLIWYFDVTATRPGSFVVPGFTASNGNEVATSLPFTLEATGTFDARDHAFVETEVDPRPRFVGEPITVSLKIGIDVTVNEDLVDAESLVAADWMFEGLPGGATPESDPFPAPGVPGASQIRTTAGKILALAESPAETRKEGRFAVLTARRRFVATQPGTVTVGPTAFRAVIGRNFERDLFGTTRIPRERKLALVNAPDVKILVKPLPDAGRGDTFSGLVGRLALDVQAVAASAGAATAPIRVKVGDSLRVSVRVSGDGNVAITPLPRVEIDGFKRFRVIEAVDANEQSPSRTLVYDIAPTSTEVKEIPPFTFEIFDTVTGTYRALSSKPIALTVLPGAAISNLAPAATPVAASTPEGHGSPSIFALFPGGAVGVVAAFALPVLALGALTIVARSRRKTGDAAVHPKRAAAPAPAAPAKRPSVQSPRPPASAATFASSLSALPADETERAKAIAEAFARHLAMLAGVSPERFVGAELDVALAPFVKERALRREAQDVVDEAERTAFGGAPLSRDLLERAAQVVARLERSLRRA